MKQVTIGNVTFSKIICGTNAFFARSHFSVARTAEYSARFDDGMIERMIARCISLGVNAVESSASERIISLLSRVRQRNPEPLRFVGSTRVDETSPLKSHQAKLALLIERRADVCLIHAQYVDRPRNGDFIEGLAPLIEQIHAAGLLAGISTHQVETIELCEKRGYGIDTYMFPLNLSGFVYPGYQGTESLQERIDIVRHTPKPFILIKTLGAGRIPPSEGLPFIAENAKPGDVVSVGFGTEDELNETVELAENIL